MSSWVYAPRHDAGQRQFIAEGRVCLLKNLTSGSPASILQVKPYSSECNERPVVGLRYNHHQYKKTPKGLNFKA